MARRLQITVREGGLETVYETRTGRRLSDLLLEKDMAPEMPCGGMGKCGKCTVRLDEKEVLACKTILTADALVEVQKASAEGTADTAPVVTQAAKSFEADAYGVAVDIGSTTIGAALVALPDGEVVATASCLNGQRVFGADVISRIRAAGDGNATRLQDIVRKDLASLMASLIPAEVTGRVERIVIAANTTMLHLLRGYSCRALGTYPYLPVTLAQETLALREVLPNVTFLSAETEVFLFPGFSAFVGADILSGVYALKEEGDMLLIDLGTNGEMALVQGKGKKRHIRVCSTAAGPVFEGAGISCGVGGVAGAISHLRICKGGEELPPGLRRRMRQTAVCGEYRVFVETIEGKAPVGLCGTGVLEAVAELYRAGVLDENGLMEEPFFETGFVLAEDALPDVEAASGGTRIVLTQEDVRAVQMAKAAICAGAATLLDRCGIAADTPVQTIVAGGFGQHMDFDAIAPLSLLPRHLISHCKGAGNTALTGAIRLLRTLAAAKEAGETPLAVLTELDALVACAEEVILAQDDAFEVRYLDAMGLGENSTDA